MIVSATRAVRVIIVLFIGRFADLFPGTDYIIEINKKMTGGKERNILQPNVRTFEATRNRRKTVQPERNIPKNDFTKSAVDMQRNMSCVRNCKADRCRRVEWIGIILVDGENFKTFVKKMSKRRGRFNKKLSPEIVPSSGTKVRCFLAGQIRN